MLCGQINYLLETGFLDPFLNFSEENLYNSREDLMINRELYKLIKDYKIEQRRENYIIFDKTVRKLIVNCKKYNRDIADIKIMFLYNHSPHTTKSLFITHLKKIFAILINIENMIYSDIGVLRNNGLGFDDKNDIFEKNKFQRFKYTFLDKLNTKLNFAMTLNNYDSYDKLYIDTYNNTENTIDKQELTLFRYSLDFRVDKIYHGLNIIGEFVNYENTIRFAD